MSTQQSPQLATSGRAYLIPESLGCDFDAPRVTSVLQMIGGRWGLEQWMKKSVATAAVDYAESGRFAALLSQGREVLIEALAKAPDQTRDEAGDTGTLVHDALEAWSSDKPLPVLIGPAADSFDHAVALLQTIEYEPLHLESVVFGGLDSEETAYAGRLDSIARVTLPGQEPMIALVDFKTSKSLRSSFAYQLAAYRYADWIMDSDGGLTKMPKVEAAFVVHARPEKARLVPVDANEAAFAAFKAARYLLAANGRRFIAKAVNVTEK